MKNKNMAQRLQSANQIGISDWLNMKPYSALIPKYDEFYLESCRKVMGLFAQHEKWLDSQDMTKGLQKELACQLVSYMEDFANEIGIWKAFVETNKELYGYYLPFYDLTNYSIEDINVQDIQFLIWHFVTKYTEEEYITDPKHDIISALAVQIYRYFDSVVEQAPTSTLYDNYFKMTDDKTFFDFKTKMSWFATKSYLLGVEISKKMQELIRELKEDKRNLDPVMLNKLFYLATDNYLFQKRSSYSALNAPEWFAKVAKCSDAMRQDILDTTYWIEGKFYFKEKQSKHLIFEHIFTKKRYNARTDSFQEVNKLLKNANDAFVMHIMRWKNEYYLSGAVYNEPMNEKKEKQYRSEPSKSPWIFSEEKLELMQKAVDETHESFLIYNGSPLAFYENEAQMEKEHLAFMDFHSTRMSSGSDIVLDESFEERNAKFKEFFDKKEKTKSPLNSKSNGVGLFYMAGLGSYVFNDAKKVVENLSATRLNEEDTVDLFVDMTNGYNPLLCTYLLEKYGDKNVKLPFHTTVDVPKHLPFYWRMNSPEEFDRPYPQTTIIDEDIMSELK